MESHASLSSWAKDVPAHSRKHRRLGVDAHADVVVVGAGIAGLSTAFMLAQEDVDVMVLDDGPIGGGETEKTTAHLANALDDRYVNLERMHGKQGAHIAAESHTEAIAIIEEIVRMREIDCGFKRVDGWLFAGREQSTDLLQRELEAARRAGLVDVEMHDRVPELGYDTGLCLRFPQQAQIHPLQYLQGLAAGVLDSGGRICTGHHVARIEGGDAPRVTTSEGRTVHARSIVVCTNTPVNDRFAIHTKQTAWRSYVVAFRVPTGSVPLALFWDTEDPYHYVRVQPGGAPDGADLLLVGGEDHKTGHAHDAEQRYHALTDWTRARFPFAEPVMQWSGQIMEPVDGVAFIGRNPTGPDNVFIATGDSGHGMTHGTIAGMILSELVREQTHPWAELYDPARKPVSALASYAAENFDVVKSYASHVLPAQVAHEEDIAPGTGGVVRHGLKQIAVHCDSQGRRTACSAVCPHLGAIVTWNAAEQSWDCPAHGSRFDAQGRVLNGPANEDLAPIPETGDVTLPLLVGDTRA